MPVFGIGSTYNGTEEKLDHFVSKGLACVGWSESSAETYFAILRSMCPGDLVFLKSFPVSNGLYIKAVGIVSHSGIVDDPELGSGVRVRWLWKASNTTEYLKLGHLKDRYGQMRGGTIYPEYNPNVILELLDKIEEGR